MLLTSDQFKLLFPKTPDPETWCEVLNQHLPTYEINTLPRLSCFLAQCAHESGEFSVLEENLNYSAQGLLKIFPKYFDVQTANNYARKPQQIANRVYANRMGNGPELSGEGWRYRGRGVIQLTGKNNYRQVSQDLFGDDRLLENPDQVCEKSLAVLTACWYWKNRNLNQFCDNGDFVTLTRRINGGVNGLADREQKLKKITEVLNQTA